MKKPLNKSTIKLLSLFTAFVIVISLSSCGKSKDELDDYADFIEFDNSKLGIEFTDLDLGIKFYPPINWELTQSSLSKKVVSRDHSANPSESFIYEPTYVFFNSSNSGLLSIGKVVTKDTSLSKGSRINFYKDILSKKYKENNLSIGKFIYSKIYFTQFKFQKEKLISFKILLENKSSDIIQFDYTIPMESLDSVQTAIKSSIGSIKLMQR